MPLRSGPFAGAADGNALLSPSVTKRLIEKFARQPEIESIDSPQLGDLTERELEVLRPLATGLSNCEVTAALYICDATAKTHVSRVLTKFGVRDRVQAVVLAHEAGVISRRQEF
ncbi:LuxR C-terminal-related transcriptional regulator [uncultured Ilumatobacter sp.]|uniref:helix-turn-helix domain-containing protein n=1 Tax=uncultured Ilumatobacter sp. TaxID=879968 RepID=UPI00374F79AA